MTNNTTPETSAELKINKTESFADIMQKHEAAQKHFNTTGTPNHDLEIEVFRGLQDLAISPAPEAGEAAYHLALICQSYNHGRPFPETIAQDICPDIARTTALYFQCAIDHEYYDALIPFAQFIQSDQPRKAEELNQWAAHLGYWEGMREMIHKGLIGEGPLSHHPRQILFWARKLHQSGAPKCAKDAVIFTISRTLQRSITAGLADEFIRAAITEVLPNPSVLTQFPDAESATTLEDLRNDMPG